MQKVDTLVHAGWVVPVEPHGVALEQHSLAIRDGRITAILPTSEAREHLRGEVELERPFHALIPGLVNAHTHAAMTLMRGLADDLPLMEWLNGHIWPAEQKWVGQRFVRDGSALAMSEMLRSGTTCFNDMYFFPDAVAHLASEVGIRAVVGLIVIDFPTAWAQGPDEYIAKGLELHDQYLHDPLVTTAFAPHAPYTVSDGPLEKLLVYAEEIDIPVHMHVHETADEVHQAVAERGQRPLARLNALGLLSPHLVAVHMTQLEAAEIEEFAAKGGHVVHCPESNLKLASGFCPVAALAKAGVNVALGTDGAASNNDLDMFGEMRTAALLGKAVAGKASALPAADALRMATLNGARALGLEEEIGSLEEGKAADVVAVDLGGVETQPLYHPLSQLVYSAGRDKVTDVWVAGRHLLKDRELTTMDRADLLGRAWEWSRQLSALS